MYRNHYCVDFGEFCRLGHMQPTDHSTFLVTMIDENEEKVLQLLRPPALAYIRELSRITQKDPEYLTYHSASITLRVRTLISHQGSKDPRNVTDHEILGTVRKAIVRLRSFER